MPEETNRGMIFMDSSDKASESEINCTIKRTIRNGTPRQQIERIMQEPVFVRSDEHLTVQLADMVAYIVNRRYKGDSGFDGWFDTITTKAYCHLGRVRDYGIKEFPSWGRGTVPHRCGEAGPLQPSDFPVDARR